jgi:hypothetical protein
MRLIKNKQYRKEDFIGKWPDITLQDKLYWTVGFNVALIAFGAIIITAYNTINYLSGVIFGLLIIILAIGSIAWNIINYKPAKKDKLLVDELTEQNAWR